MNNNIPVPADYIKNFEQLGFGMFVHFGLYSEIGKGEWVYNICNLKEEDYCKTINNFNVKSMAEIVAVAKSAGCKYICLTTRHHDGFSLYDTKGLSEFDVMHSPCKRDLIKEFVEECKKEDIMPVFYHTTLDWLHKDFENDFDKYLDYLYDSVEILCTQYGEIGGMWFDGNWSKPDADWKEDRLYKMIHRHQPKAMVINNTGLENRGAKGAEEIDSVTYERGLPGIIDRTGWKKYLAGEMCETLCDHWGVANFDINFKSVKQLIEELCECRKVGANFLLNIGPSADGTVSKMQQAIMESIGLWMSFYGKAIYNGRPYLIYDDKKDFILRDVNDEKTAYLFRFNPGHSAGDTNVTLEFKNDTAVTLDKIDKEIESLRWLDTNEDIPFEQKGDKVSVNLLGFPYGYSLCVRVAEIKFK